MKDYEFLDAVGGIESRFVEKATNRQTKHSPWKYVVSVAACFVLLVGIYYAYPKLAPPPTLTPDPSGTTERTDEPDTYPELAPGVSFNLPDNHEKLNGKQMISGYGESVKNGDIAVNNGGTLYLGQGYQPVCGFNYGAGLYSRVRKAFWFLVKAVAVWCISVTVLVELLTPQVVGLFPDAEEKVRELAVTILRLQCATLVLNAFIVPSNMSQQTMGMMIPASTLAMARQGLFMIPLALILPRLFGLTGLELAQPLGDVLTMILAIILQSRVLRMLRQPDRRPEA